MNDPLSTILWSIGSALAVTVALCHGCLATKRQPSAWCALIGMITSSFVAIAYQDDVFTDGFWQGGRERGVKIIVFYMMINFMMNGFPSACVVAVYKRWINRKKPIIIADASGKHVSSSIATGLSLGIPLGLFVLVMVYSLPPYGPWLQAKNLEFQVKHNIDPGELQKWAIQVLAEHPDHYQDFYGTTLPAGLKKVQGFGHCVEIFTSGMGSESSVCVFGGSKGGPLLVVASPSYPTPKSISILPWKPGIYFAGAR